MTDTSSGPKVFDVTIICTTDDHQAAYWTKRLSEGICRSPSANGKASSPDLKKAKTDDVSAMSSSSSSSETPSSLFPLALAVSEDWSAGGAGNGLGTLYAYEKACGVAKERHGVDLDALLMEKKISAAIYHTAGKGTRLAPLPASENNNKPGVKLPFCHTLSDGTLEPLTVLEAVVKQTGVYAPSRLGRLSVYWGDQVFVPSAPFVYTPTHHVDIMCTLLGDTAPTAAEWAAQGLDKYGVIAVSQSGDAAQVEKVDHATATRMLRSLGDVGQVGPSLGSFSVSAAMLRALCREYAPELSAKTGKFDTDPHFWMPLTLAAADYVSLMAQKGVAEGVSRSHHQRMSRLKESFVLSDGMGLFGAVDVGRDACWWDYGQLKYYYDYNIKLLDTDDNAKYLRQFLGVTSQQMHSVLGSDAVRVDDVSCVFGSSIATAGTVARSVLASVTAQEVHAEDAILINCTAPKITAGKGSVLYNLVDESEIVVPDGAVVVGVTDEEGHLMTLKSRRDICGGKAWKQVVEGNELSFEGVHAKNKDANVTAIEAKRKAMHAKVAGMWRN